MGRKGRKKWQEEIWEDNHERIRTVLNQEPGLTKKQIHKKTRLSRRIINKHLNALISKGDVESKGRSRKGKKFYMKTYYEKLAEFLSERLSEEKKFFDSLARGEEFWLWLPDINHPEKILKFKMVETKILRQD